MIFEKMFSDVDLTRIEYSVHAGIHMIKQLKKMGNLQVDIITVPTAVHDICQFTIFILLSMY